MCKSKLWSWKAWPACEPPTALPSMGKWCRKHCYGRMLLISTNRHSTGSRLIRNCAENILGHHYWQCSRDGDVTALSMLTSAAMEDVTTQQPSEITQSLCSATESIFPFVFLCVCHLGSFLTVILITQSLPVLLAQKQSEGAEQEWEVTGRIHLSQFWKLTEPAVLFTGMSDPLSPSPKNSTEINSV